MSTIFNTILIVVATIIFLMGLGFSIWTLIDTRRKYSNDFFKHRNLRKGRTLVEVMAVVTVIGFVAMGCCS